MFIKIFCAKIFSSIATFNEIFLTVNNSRNTVFNTQISNLLQPCAFSVTWLQTSQRFFHGHLVYVGLTQARPSKLTDGMYLVGFQQVYLSFLKSGYSLCHETILSFSINTFLEQLYLDSTTVCTWATIEILNTCKYL